MECYGLGYLEQRRKLLDGSHFERSLCQCRRPARIGLPVDEFNRRSRSERGERLAGLSAHLYQDSGIEGKIISTHSVYNFKIAMGVGRLRRKYMDGSDSKWIAECEAKIIRLEGEFSGYLSAKTILKMKKAVRIILEEKEFVLLDEGYHVMNYLPDGKNWALSANYDTEWNLIEWYFDMTKGNGVDEVGKPYFDDLYLDYVVTPDNASVVLDEDELLEALQQREITQEDVDLAYRALEEVRAGIGSSAEGLTKFCEECWKYFAQHH